MNPYLNYSIALLGSNVDGIKTNKVLEDWSGSINKQ
jgi:hypothetical protein